MPRTRLFWKKCITVKENRVRFLRWTSRRYAFARLGSHLLLAYWRINYAAFYLRLRGAHKGSPGDAAAANSVAKAGCAAKRSASSALGTHVWTVLTHFVGVCTVCIRRTRLFKRDRGRKARFTYLDARTRKMYFKIASKFRYLTNKSKKLICYLNVRL